MMLAAIYLAMLLTDWGYPSSTYNGVPATATFFSESGNASYWI